MYKIFYLILIFGISLSWAGLPDEELADTPGWIAKTDGNGNVAWHHNPAAEDELEKEMPILAEITPSTSLVKFNCSSDYDCFKVETIFGSAKCSNHVCECRVENGFIGLALEWSKCMCPPPKTIFYTLSQPVCNYNFVQQSNYFPVSPPSSSYNSQRSISPDYSSSLSLSR